MRLFELEKGYTSKGGAPLYKPSGTKVSPFYQKQLGPGWDQASRDKDLDDIMGPGTAQKRRDIRANPNSGPVVLVLDLVVAAVQSLVDKMMEVSRQQEYLTLMQKLQPQPAKNLDNNQ